MCLLTILECYCFSLINGNRYVSVPAEISCSFVICFMFTLTLYLKDIKTFIQLGETAK